MHEVFISYSNWDKKYADAVCHYLEQANLRCFIAPRDIHPGADWAASINAAIESAKVFVLILSPRSNTSNQVFREVNLAVKNKLKIITFKVEEVELDKGLEYYIGVSHWLDALTKPLEQHLNNLTNCVLEACPADITREKESHLDPVIKKKRSKHRRVLITAAGAFLLVAIFFGYYLLQHRDTGYEKRIDIDMLFSHNAQVGHDFLSSDLTLYAEPQKDGGVLIRSTEDKSVKYSIQTGLTDNGFINTAFSADKQSVVIYNDTTARLYHLADLSNPVDLPISNRLLGVKFINSNEYGMWFTDEMDEYYRYAHISAYQIGDSRTGQLIRTYTVNDSTMIFYGFTHDAEYAVGIEGEANAPMVIRLADGAKLYGEDALAICNENVDFPPFSKDGKYVVKYPSHAFDDSTIQSSVAFSILSCSNGAEVCNIPCDGTSYGHFDENGLFTVRGGKNLDIYELMSGKKLYSFPAEKLSLLGPLGFINGTKHLMILAEKKDYGGRLFVSDFNVDTQLLTYGNKETDISTESGGAFGDGKIVFFYNEIDRSLSCQLIRYYIDEQGSVVFGNRAS